MNNPARMFICVLMLSVGASVVHGQEINQQAEFQKPIFTFTFTVTNPNDIPQTITKVGAQSRIRSGSFGCLSATPPNSGILNILANYGVSFHVANKETIKDAEPQIRIDPHDAVRLSVSLLPKAMGACGPWSVDVSAFVVFDNGKRATTQPQLITSGDYNSYAPSSLKDEQLKTALKHEDSTIRAQAIEALMQSNWDRETIKLVLQAKFEDSNTEVRTTAAKVAARMGFKALAAKIASLLIAARSTLEVSIYSYALGTLKDPGTIDALVLRFIDFKSGTRELAHLTLEGTYTPQKALLEIQHPDVPVKLRPLLIKYKEWASPSATEEDVSRYIELCKMLVAYRDVASAPMLLEALIKSPRERILSAIIFDLYSLDDVIVQDPFILAMRPAFETTLKRQNWNDRMIALKMLCLMSSDRTYVENILRGGLKDEVGKVRRWAAELAARFKYRSLAPEIINLYKSSTEETDKIVYCSALESMGIDCQ